MHEMTRLQRFFFRILPRNWAEDMRAESQQWMLRCTCGHEQSVWALGGIRWKAAGNPRRLMRCPACRQTTWHTVYRRRASGDLPR